MKRSALGLTVGLVYLLLWGCANRVLSPTGTSGGGGGGGQATGTTGAHQSGAAGSSTGAGGASTDAGSDASDGTFAAATCACDTTVRTTGLLQRYVYVARDCFCASPYGFLCRDLDQAAALCARADVHQVLAASFSGCTQHYLHVTLASTAKGRPTYATLRFDGNSFAGASYEADLICNNLPADEVNDMYLYVYTNGYDKIDPTCGSSEESNPCGSDAGSDAPSSTRSRP